MNRRERLELEIAQRQAQLQDMNARDRVKQRKQDTRRKIIAGALALEHCKQDKEFKKVMDWLIDKSVSNDRDRALFNLSPVKK